MIKKNDRVAVVSPEPTHAHMRGTEGNVIEVKVNKRSRRWEAQVKFLGGVGRFSLDELERLESPKSA